MFFPVARASGSSSDTAPQVPDFGFFPTCSARGQGGPSTSPTLSGDAPVQGSHLQELLQFLSEPRAGWAGRPAPKIRSCAGLDVLGWLCLGDVELGIHTGAGTRREPSLASSPPAPFCSLGICTLTAPKRNSTACSGTGLHPGDLPLLSSFYHHSTFHQRLYFIYFPSQLFPSTFTWLL